MQEEHGDVLRGQGCSKSTRGDAARARRCIEKTEMQQEHGDALRIQRCRKSTEMQ